MFAANQIDACASVRLQIDLVQGMMDCLYAECIPCVTQCVMAELEKLGQQYRVALKVAKVWLLRIQVTCVVPVSFACSWLERPC